MDLKVGFFLVKWKGFKKILSPTDMGLLLRIFSTFPKLCLRVEEKGGLKNESNGAQRDFGD